MVNLFAETRNGNVALIWLNRPKQFNALNSAAATIGFCCNPLERLLSGARHCSEICS
ncbi:hypothetical protein [Paracoccus sp. MKU1]|uniref:hypothetical protein n=1 Tax=Paracoccus sp. MKU1 TaxID=1745182 RepID=UPI000A4BC9DC|nr:hypothetical protein [Paracoccus sp. MKU1]